MPDNLATIEHGRRAAFWVFVVAQGLIFAGLIWNFHGRWFIADEWEFIAGRRAGNLSDLLRPYHEHWSTLPILLYRLLWTVVGIRSYVPYLISIVILHIAVGSLLWLIMIRASVWPWIATLCAVIFSLYGAGFSDISYAFNIGFDGSIVFGLLYLLAVDHDGPPTRRDTMGVVAGLAALMCSGIGVAMLGVVIVDIRIRHGVRRALLLTLPLAGVYLFWFATIGHGGFSRHSTLPEIGQFVILGIASSFSSISSSPIIGSMVAILLVFGVIVTIRARGSVELRSRYGAPCALLIGAVVFLVLTGYGRANSSLPSVDTYAASRYLYVVAAMLIPSLAIAASQLIERWPRAWPVIVLVLVLGIPGNITLLHRNNYLHTLSGYRDFILSIPRLPIAEHLPRSVRPDPYFDKTLTVGWLLDGVKSGRIPLPSSPPSRAQVAYWTLRLAWRPGLPVPASGCEAVRTPALVHVADGTRLTFDGAVNVVSRFGQKGESPALQLSGPTRSATYRSSWPMEVKISTSAPGQKVTICTPRQSR